MNRWKTCSHKWESLPKYSEFGTVYQDECSLCGCIGILASEPNEAGFYGIVALPMAGVIDLNEFRKRREKSDEQSSVTTNSGTSNS